MPFKNLKIVVLLRESVDPRPPAKLLARGAGISDRGARCIPNPADLAALEEALCLKDIFGASVTVVAVGPKRVEDSLRLASSLGADRVIRFWDHGLEGGDTAADARMVGRLISILEPTLVFTGNRLLDKGDDAVVSLASAAAGYPCISAAVSLLLKAENVEVFRKGDRGGRQIVAAPFPCTVLFEETRSPRYPSVDAVTNSLHADVEQWGLPEIGIPFWQVGAAGALLPLEEFGVPRPDPVRVVTPDPELPAFDRIISLLSGGIKAREGRQHFLPAEDAAAELWRMLSEEGLVPEAP